MDALLGSLLAQVVLLVLLVLVLYGLVKLVVAVATLVVAVAKPVVALASWIGPFLFILLVGLAVVGVWSWYTNPGGVWSSPTNPNPNENENGEGR